MAKSNSTELMEALVLLAKEKGMTPETLIEKIQTGITNAIKRDYPRNENIHYDIDIAKNKFDVSILKTVVEEVEDPANEITLEEARTISKRLNLGDMCPIKLDTKHFGRIAAQTAKQVIKQGIKEVEREQLVEQWGGLQNEAVSAEVKKVETDSLNALVSVNGTEIMLFRSDQIPGEKLKEGDVIKVFVSGVSSADRRPTLRVSRTNRDLIRRLFELEVPEIGDGTVEIKAVSREAGSRSKIAVISNNENVDALGACIGPQKSRITKICEELCGEKIDVVMYSEDPKEFIKQALKPANVINVDIPDEEVRACSVTVPDSQLSLAIGNKGQNAKLAARLTGYKIDIKPESGRFFGDN
ncbi:MAG: transcription termination/antitermination protein NusA [Ruminiclostridium sp.]|nr:transcription termination/antitermination protein NusA [Ruminiclostridium sp.]